MHSIDDFNPKNSIYFGYYKTYEQFNLKSQLTELSTKKFYSLGAKDKNQCSIIETKMVNDYIQR